MIYGLEPVIFIGRVLLVIAAVATTAFPALYAFSPWYRSPLGRMVMLQSVTLALALLLKLVLTFFLDNENRPYLLWLNVGILLTISITSFSLTYLLWKFRMKARVERRKNGRV